METKKTSLRQRIIIIIVAILLLGSTVAAYLLIIINNGNSSGAKKTYTDAEIAEYKDAYEKKTAELEHASTEFSSKYLEKMISYKSEVKAFNAASAESDGLKTRDVKIGSGAELSASSTDYAAYYIGWCPDETVFDSSFDDFKTPSKMKAPIIVNEGSLITGWYQGVNGMKLGGVRVLSIPSNLAYGTSYNPCDPETEGSSSPLNFLILAFEITDDYKKLSDEANKAYMRYMYALYGMEYTE